MTTQTPREAAWALLDALHVSVPGTTHHRNLFMAIETAFASRDRALLAEDEAVIEAMREAPFGDLTGPRVKNGKITRNFIRVALAALRRHRGVE
jgi:hypothetical protein